MGLLRVLGLPVTGPVQAGLRILGVLVEQAEQEYYDETAIQEELRALELERETGQVHDEEFDRREAELLRRWIDARAYHAQKQTET